MTGEVFVNVNLHNVNKCAQALLEAATTAQAPTAFVPRQFLAGLARHDLVLFLTGLWNATDDGSIFLHCFTCSKWNHMLYRTAPLLSVIGSTCTRQPSSKAEPPQPARPRLPFSSPGSAVPHSEGG